ncbi:MAG: small basic protein [Candidatus Omnitrophota bacterium]
MSQHPSLLGSSKGKQHRSVLKRYERLKHLIEKEKWDEDASSVFALPKIKSIKFKVKKEKAAATATDAAGAPAAAAGTAAAGGKAGAPAPAASKAGADKAAPKKDAKAK